MKTAVLFHRFGPYHIARIKAAARFQTIDAIELSAFSAEYPWDWVDLPETIKRYAVFQNQDIYKASVATFRRRLFKILDESRPDCVALSGWSEKGMLLGLEWCLKNKRPAICMSDSSESDYIRHFWKEWIKKQIVPLYAGGIIAGTPHRAYLQKLGVDKNRIFGAYDVVDNPYFASAAEKIRKNPDVARQKYQLPEQYFLVCCRFIPEKNFPVLLRAYADYMRSDRRQAALPLVILGDGPLRPEIEAIIARLQIEAQVRLAGFQQYQDLPSFYALARALILPSRKDSWGLVVNEAMACGLPVVVSDRCGCATDLVRPADNGYIFAADSSTELTRYLIKLGDSPSLAQAMGKRSQAIIQAYSPEIFGKNLFLLSRKLLAEGLLFHRNTYLQRLCLKALLALR